MQCDTVKSAMNVKFYITIEHSLINLSMAL